MSDDPAGILPPAGAVESKRPLSLRRMGREAALQYLFQQDFNAREGEAPTKRFWEMRVTAEETPAPERVRTHAAELVAGVNAHLPEIDAAISAKAANYDLGRIAAVDRNVLRIAIYEMLFCTDIPPVVSINEAIEVAKAFGGEESGRFVNGILDRFRSELKRSARGRG